MKTFSTTSEHPAVMWFFVCCCFVWVVIVNNIEKHVEFAYAPTCHLNHRTIWHSRFYNIEETLYARVWAAGRSFLKRNRIVFLVNEQQCSIAV